MRHDACFSDLTSTSTVQGQRTRPRRSLNITIYVCTVYLESVSKLGTEPNDTMYLPDSGLNKIAKVLIETLTPIAQGHAGAIIT